MGELPEFLTCLPSPCFLLVGPLRIDDKLTCLQATRSHLRHCITKPTRTPAQDASKVNKFLKFCSQTGLVPLSPGQAPPKQLILDYVAWLQRFGGFTGDWKGARDYVCKYLRSVDAPFNPLDSLPAHTRRSLTTGFNNGRAVVSRPTMAFPRPLARDLLIALGAGDALDRLLAIALLLYIITAVRPGNLLRGTSKTEQQALHIGDIIVIRNTCNRRQPPVFLRHNDGKTVHKPVCEPLPYHPLGEGFKCAPTAIRALLSKRVEEGAQPDDFVFITPKTRKPITTDMANRRIRIHIRHLFENQGIDPIAAKFFTMKSARKGMASFLEQAGVKAPSISKKMGHGSIDSQISYHCNFYEANPEVNARVYSGI